jgi:hypothetical protein
MVTMGDRITATFTVEISQGNGDSVLVVIKNADGEKRHYQVSRWRLAFFASTNPIIRDAVDFLLGDA